jgi:glycosyltransferase involved in cell wall biosynthesis
MAAPASRNLTTASLEEKTQERPLITFALVAYNQEHYIREAVEGAFRQTYSPLEILLSDDCSQDRTFEIIKEMAAEYKGPHSIALNRNVQNLGVGAHINKVMTIAKGELIVAAAGDDISLPDRAERIYAAYASSNEKYAYIYSNVNGIDQNGETCVPFHRSARSHHLTLESMAKRIGGAVGASSAWSKNIFTLFGPLDNKIIHEDAVLPFRAALAGRVLFINDPLILYRRHDNNLWKSINDLQGVDAIFSNLSRHAEGNLQVVKSRISDLTKYTETFQDENPKFPEIMRNLLMVKEVASLELSLTRASSKIEKMKLLTNAIGNGINAGAIAKYALIFLLPRLYIKIRNVKIHLNKLAQ